MNLIYQYEHPKASGRLIFTSNMKVRTTSIFDSVISVSIDSESRPPSELWDLIKRQLQRLSEGCEDKQNYRLICNSMN